MSATGDAQGESSHNPAQHLSTACQVGNLRVLTASLAVVQELEGQEREEVEWGEVLHVVHSGLVATRRLLWDESERKIIALLSSSSAFEGDHFLQVLLPSHEASDREYVCRF